jgi:hypothetical protein
MSIASDVTRIEGAKAAIKAAIEGKGVTVPDATLLDGMASLIESIEAGGGSSTKDFYFATITPSNTLEYMHIPFPTIPDVLVMVGPISGLSPNHVGLAIHIKDVDGGIYQEKWRYQSTKYLVGTSATDGSLFTLSKYYETGVEISINSGETSYGKYFGAAAYRVFAAKLF